MNGIPRQLTVLLRIGLGCAGFDDVYHEAATPRHPAVLRLA